MKEEFYYKPAPSPIRTWKTIVIAFAITFFIFLILPLADIIFRHGMIDRHLRDIDTVNIFQPPIERPEPEIEQITAKEIPKLDKRIPRQIMPTHIVADLMLEMGDVGGFTLSFDIGDAVFEVFELDSHPSPVSQILPIYPMGAKHKGIEGKVELMFIVRTDGSVDNVEVLSSYPGDIFTRAAVRAVRQWRFRPGIRGGQKVNTRVFLPLKFELE